jgi:DNA/RNA-binding domain of Phe-tRNA-synthetase-like protein
VVRITAAARKRLPALELRWARLEHADDPDRRGSLPADAGPGSLEDVKADPVAQAYRSFFWDVDVDPTKRRPAGEALARRLVDTGLPEIHLLVDAYNRASAATIVALSAFDQAALDGELELDLPGEDETLDAIGETEPVEPTGDHPVWRDERGIVGLAAYRDSQRTALGPDSQAAIVLALAPQAVPAERLDRAFDVLAELAAPAGWRLTHHPERRVLGS